MRSILDSHDFSRDVELAKSAIRKLEARTKLENDAKKGQAVVAKKSERLE